MFQDRLVEDKLWFRLINFVEQHKIFNEISGIFLHIQLKK